MTGRSEGRRRTASWHFVVVRNLFDSLALAKSPLNSAWLPEMRARSAAARVALAAAAALQPAVGQTVFAVFGPDL